MGFQPLVYLVIAISTVNSNIEVSSWDPSLISPCTWDHVTCNNNNSVLRLDLGNARLSGPLISSLAKLANLQYL
ncbi:hypothetical protein ACHQM5_010430 [Ranunculus cassubicifolius]